MFSITTLISLKLIIFIKTILNISYIIHKNNITSIVILLKFYTLFLIDVIFRIKFADQVSCRSCTIVRD